MRIWQRIYLAVMIVTILFIHLTGIVIITSQYKQNLQSIRQDAQREAVYLEERIKGEIQRLSTNKESIEVVTVSYENTAIAVDDGTISQSISNVSEQTNDYGIFITLSEETYGNTRFRKELLHDKINQGFRKTEQEMFYCKEFDGEVYGRDISVWLQMDATQIRATYWNQMRQLLLFGSGLSLIAAVVLMILVFYFLRPLKVVRQGVHHIASGHYGTRLPLEGRTELTELVLDVNEMAEKIQSNIQKLEDTNENRRMFIGNMAHEMKTPLTSILGFADLLSIKPGMTETERREFSEIIVKETKRLQNLSGKLLELVQIQNGQIDRKPVNLGELLEETITMQETVMKEKSITILKSLCYVYIAGDRDLLQSLFFNLLDNSRKASSDGGEIKVSIETEDSLAVVRIRDYGIGMEKKDVEHVKEPFYMIDKSRSRKAGGSGLGLALCAEIVRLHHGTFRIESEPGAGCLSILSFLMEADHETKE